MHQLLKKELLTAVFIVFIFWSCTDNSKVIPFSECLDTYQQCDSIYHLDTTYSNVSANLLYARWQITKGNYDKAIQVLDSLENLVSHEKGAKLYQQVILYQFLAKKDMQTLDVNSIDLQLNLDLSPVHNINMLQLKSTILRRNQEVNYSYASNLYAEYLMSQLSAKELNQVYYLPWAIHCVNLIRENNDSTLCKYYLEKTLNYCQSDSPGCRWMKTLLLTLDENLNEEQIHEIKEQVLDSSQYAPRIKRTINTHLSYVSSDNHFAIKSLLSEIDSTQSICLPVNFYNTTYLVDAYLSTNNLEQAEILLDSLFACDLSNIVYYNFALYRKQSLLYFQYLKTNDQTKLKQLYNCSKKLIQSYIKQGKSIINEHYADAIYKSNNIFLETLFELKSKHLFSDNEMLIHLNNIKNLYNKVSDTRSFIGNKKPSNVSMKEINYLKHQIEKRELKVNRYLDIGYQDMSVFKDLYLLHKELYELKEKLPEIQDFSEPQDSQNLQLSNLSDLTQVLDFVQTDSSIFLSRITTDEIELRKLDKESVLTAISQKKLWLLGNSKVAKPNYIDTVFVELISKDHPNVIFIPDGVLFDYPIETIQDYSGNYLLGSYFISYASQISEAIQYESSVLEDAFFAASYSSVATLKDRSVKSYPELEFGQNEINQIIKSYSDFESFSGFDLTEENLFNATSRDVVHISSHSSSSSDNPLDNYILVRDNQGNGVPIYGFTLKSRQWNSGLVILSSCESGTGTIKPGAGVFSLSRDFIQAGAQTVIKSLWKVNEQSTTELMVYFHQNLRQGLTVVGALKQAKIAVQSQAEYQHPYFWAGFILEGNPNLICDPE